MRSPLLLVLLLLAMAISGQEAVKPSLPATGESLPAVAPQSKIRVLLIGGGSSHDFEKWFHQADAETLQAGGCVTAYTPNVEESLALMRSADVLVLSTNQPAFEAPAFQQALAAFAQAGKGLVLLHPGLWYNWPASTGYNAHLAGGGARSHDALGPFTVTVAAPTHPVMAGMPATFEVQDELYQVTLDPAAKVEVLASTSVSQKTGKEHPSIWTVAHERGKIVCIALGHDDRVHLLAAFKSLLGNAVRWAAAK